ncbi:MAG: DNA cytosine methyltransferase [Kiritimatiellales bacterium]|nr:DNA cytosine methyltransferase [Kiritimatiellales bacterium]
MSKTITMPEQLTLGSLFSGSGGFELAGMLCGIKPVWNCEVEPFAILVTSKRLPDVKHYGDISTVSGAELEPVDVITFGSPCTSLSCAGLRAGLEGKGSVLFFQAIRIIKEMRKKTNGQYPRWICWENVFGIFSSSQGCDFQRVLEEIIGVVVPGATMPAPDGHCWPYADCYVGDGWSVAYRTLSAEWFGCAQRRKRIYLVADFGNERGGDVLFEREGVRRDFTQGFRAWEGTAGNPADCAGTPERVLCLNDQREANEPIRTAPPALSVENHPTDDRVKIRPDGTTQTLTARCGTGGMNTPLVAEPQMPVAFGVCSKASHSMQSDNPHSGFYEAKTARTLDRGGGNPSCAQGGIAVVAIQSSIIGRADKNGPRGSGVGQDISFALDTIDRHGVAYAMTTGSFTDIGENVAPTLQHRDYKDPPIVTEQTPREVPFVVRRLTPTECAVLQGFPRWWCSDLAITEPTEEQITFWQEVWEVYSRVTGERKPKTRAQVVRWLAKPYSDAAEYRLWGNGIALPCAVYVLGGSVEVENETGGPVR